MWSNNYGGDGIDFSNYVQQTTDGGYLISGFTSSFGTGEFDIWLIKTDDMGYMEWNQTIDGVSDIVDIPVER